LIKFAGPVAAAEERIVERLPELVGNLLVIANGMTVAEPMPNGGTTVYTRAPDFRANQYLLDRIMGKPEVLQEPDPSEWTDEELIAKSLRAIIAVIDPGEEDLIAAVKRYLLKAVNAHRQVYEAPK
jgi:hypothetical protein